jgi:hypothetical protein
MKDPERTPFNIGERVDLADFREEEAVRDLKADPATVRAIFQHTNGHPYLTLRVFQSLSEQPLAESIEARIESLFFGEHAARDSNLQFVRDMLTKRAPDRDAVLARYRDVWRGKRVPDREADPVSAWLLLSGVVRAEDGVLKVRNPIYRKVFDSSWIRKNRQVNWLRVAAYAGGTALGLLILIAAVLAPFAYIQRNKAIAEKVNADSLRLAAQAFRTTRGSYELRVWHRLQPEQQAARVSKF